GRCGSGGYQACVDGSMRVPVLSTSTAHNPPIGCSPGPTARLNKMKPFSVPPSQFDALSYTFTSSQPSAPSAPSTRTSRSPVENVPMLATAYCQRVPSNAGSGAVGAAVGSAPVGGAPIGALQTPQWVLAG